jgi:hypothetical protein
MQNGMLPLQDVVDRQQDHTSQKSEEHQPGKSHDPFRSRGDPPGAFPGRVRLEVQHLKTIRYRRLSLQAEASTAVDNRLPVA